MIKRSTAFVALSLFVFSLLCFIWSCQNPNPVVKNEDKNRDTTKKVNINLHLVISDSLGKAYTDTIYKIDLASLDTFRIKQMAECAEPPKRTGGSSPCTIEIKVSKDEEPKDPKDPKDDDDKDPK